MDANAIKGNEECSIGFIGQGIIYQNVKRHVESKYEIMPLTMANPLQQFASCGIIIYCSDIWSPRTLQEINRRCLQSGVALLPVYTQFAEGIIGPYVVPQEKGCTSCAELRKLGATSSEAERELLCQCLYGEREFLVSQPWLSLFSIEMLTALIEEEITTYIQRPDQIRTRCALLSISLETLDCRRHSFLPSSYCPDCGEQCEDTADMAIITLQPCPKQDMFIYRNRQAKVSEEQMLAEYVDGRTGLISFLTMENSNLLPIASSRLYSERREDTEPSDGTGCTLRPEQSRVVAILEALERYAGLRPRNKRTIMKPQRWMRASYRQLVQQGQQVLDPTTLGLHNSEQVVFRDAMFSEAEVRTGQAQSLRASNHDHCFHQLVSYHHDLICNWVWGYSFQHQSPILVPEHCAYYGVSRSQENPAFVYEISNGCALGSCLEEAIFHGVAEVVERDAFLLAWYAQLSLPRLNLLSVTDPIIRLLVKHLEYQSGYTIHALNATLDHALPCLCLLAIDEQDREGMPKASIATGSHPHPEQALLRALRELTSSLAFSPQLYQQRRAQALEMLANASLVQAMDDHPLVYYLPEAFERLNFFCQTQHQQTFGEAFSDFYHHPSASMDLRDDLELLIGYYLKRDIDVIVVDQTAPEHIPCSLRCVKVLMPGMLPMTFGQSNRRISGFERLHQLPFVLGYRSHPLTEAEINPHPHPFF